MDSAQDFVLQPHKQTSVGNPGLAAAFATYTAADTKQQQAWLGADADGAKHGKHA